MGMGLGVIWLTFVAYPLCTTLNARVILAAPNVSWQVFWPILVLYALYSLLLVPLGFWLGLRLAFRVIAADQTVIRHVYLLRSVYAELGIPAGLLTILFQRAPDTPIQDWLYISLPASAQWIISVMFPLVLTMTVIGYGALAVSWWIEAREKRSGRWLSRRQQTGGVTSQSTV